MAKFKVGDCVYHYAEPELLGHVIEVKHNQHGHVVIAIRWIGMPPFGFHPTSGHFASNIRKASKLMELIYG